MYRKDRLSREVLLISNNIATTLLLNISDAGNTLYGHILCDTYSLVHFSHGAGVGYFSQNSRVAKY